MRKMINKLFPVLVLAMLCYSCVTKENEATTTEANTKIDDPMANWIKIKAGESQIIFPNLPVDIEREVNSEFGFVKAYIKLYQAPKDSIANDGNVAYVFSYSDFPNVDKLSDSKREAFLNSRRDGAISNSNGQLLLEERIFYNNMYEGRRWRALIQNGTVITNTYAYLVGNRFYLMQVLSIKEFDNNDKIYKFLKSFALHGDTPTVVSIVKNEPKDSLQVIKYLQNGKVKMSSKGFKDAIEEFNLALQIDPNNETALVSKAICYMSMGKWKDAIEPCDIAIKINAKQAVAYFVRGSAKMNSGEDGCSDFLKSKGLGFDKGALAYRLYCN